jgi:hypothetical protein
MRERRLARHDPWPTGVPTIGRRAPAARLLAFALIVFVAVEGRPVALLLADGAGKTRTPSACCGRPASSGSSW